MLLFKNQLHVNDIVYYDFFCYLKSLLNLVGCKIISMANWLVCVGHSLCKTCTYTHGSPLQWTVFTIQVLLAAHQSHQCHSLKNCLRVPKQW